MQERLQPRALDIAGLAAQLRQAAADARFEAIRPELDRIEVAGGKLSRLVADLTRKKSIDRLFANGDAMAAQEVLRERLRGPIKVIRDCDEILLEALPGLDGSSLRGDVLDLLTESIHMNAEVYDAVSFATDRADSRVTALPPAEKTPAAETGTILVVDDLHLNRELFALRLGVEGHRVVTAEGGREALEKLAAQPIDLVLLDIMMPGMDEYAVLDRIKGNEALRHIPVIMITALDKMESVIRCIAAGAEDYLPRSADPVLLRARISACLEKKFWNDRQREHVDRVVAAMNRVERGEVDARLEVAGEDVYAQLYRGFNLMTDGLRDAEHIISVARDLSGELHLDALLARIMSATTELLDADRSTLFIYDRKTDELWSRVAEGVGVREIRFPSSAGLAGLAFTTGETQNVSDPYAHPAFNPEFDSRTGYPTTHGDRQQGRAANRRDPLRSSTRPGSESARRCSTRKPASLPTRTRRACTPSRRRSRFPSTTLSSSTTCSTSRTTTRASSRVRLTD